MLHPSLGNSIQVLHPHLDHRAKPLLAHSQIPLPFPTVTMPGFHPPPWEALLTLPLFLPDEELNFLFAWFTFHQQFINGIVVTEPD